MTARFLLLALPLAASLAGCISFGAKPPEALLTLTATAAVPVGNAQDSAAAKSIVIDVPVVPQSLATARVPVQATPTSIAYVKEAVWAEPPARLFARLVSDTVTSRTGRVVLSPVQAISDPSSRLGGELRTFGLDAASNSAVVTFDGALTRAGDDRIEKRRFEARVPVAAIDAASAGTALNEAANQVAAEVADWIGR
ncbi:ABC-type transport auxiliary lipoprotein family protein [Sphingomonas sp.]|jgi:cholesterol transport system auxiliary component|uniref:ABC-type transport auxiliary lipoprotein family protein n=1 Tax=Sphingomonas sp. TaxID=28214 RepID=UPI0035C7AB04